MIAEVENLLKDGVSKEDLIYYGLEYKYITMFLTGDISMDEMKTKLETEIHRFAKRQATWFRRMEKQGFEIQWIPFDMPVKEKLEYITSRLDNDY